jgi:hypothetical protein
VFDAGQSLGASSSLQVQQQLQGKQETLELFVNFLKAVNLWNSVRISAGFARLAFILLPNLYKMSK